MAKYKNIIIISVMAVMLFGLSLCFLLKEPDDFSESERRVLSKFPELTADTIMSGEFMADFEVYTQDQFPWRDQMRSLKAVTVLGVFNQSDNNDIYVADGHVSKLEYPLRSEMLDNAGKHFANIYDTYLADTDTNLYFSIIPDKNYFLAEEYGYLSVDYNELISIMREKTDYMEYIDIFDELTISDYYRTDTHWKQENLLPIAEKLADAMGVTLDDEYTVNTLENPFYGVYYGQSALPLNPDTIRYLTSETLENCTVTSYDTGMPVTMPVYDMEAAIGRDPYEMFLCGADALVVIENPNAETDKELVVFRDSYSSSLAPLLVEGYAKITLVDTRYIQSSLIGNFVEFEDQDVLFIYGTMLLNNSTMLK